MCSTYRAAPQGEIDARGLNVSTQKRKCSGGDLNPHALRHTPLKRTCLPFHHPSEEMSFLPLPEWRFHARQKFRLMEKNSVAFFAVPTEEENFMAYAVIQTG